eukprot:scpid86450/ scgid27420/ Putative beta-lactamase hcpC; Cysteine-rich protein C
MSAAAGRRLLSLSARTCRASVFTRSFSSVHKHSLIASRCIPHAPCIVQSQLAGCVSRQLCDNATEEKFEDRLVYVVRRLADQRKMKEGILDDVIALMRDAVAQGHDSNPDHNEELEARMEKLGDTMLYVAGMFLIMSANELGPRCMSLAVPFLRKCALMGHPAAKYSYARLLLDGMGVEQDLAEAFRLFNEVADGIADNADPYPQAAFTIGTLYFYGKGVDVDIARALEYFNKALDAGLTQALHTLGMLYMRGDGVTIDYDKALDYYRRGVTQDDARCMNELASCYLGGTCGLEKDEKRALELYHDAARLGNTNAMHSLGVCFWEGRGVDLDQDKAAYWWAQAADEHHPRACVNLAQLYLDGVGVKKDVEMARGLLQEAARRGLIEAGTLLEEMERRLKEDP